MEFGVTLIAFLKSFFCPSPLTSNPSGITKLTLPGCHWAKCAVRVVWLEVPTVNS